MEAQRKKYELLGHSPVMAKLKAVIEKAAAHPAAKVLITGPTGSGKEVVAQTIHFRSARAAKPFVPFNCSNVTRDLIESRLFGHEKGAFTSADRQTEGIFGDAEGGTIFLDEVGELPLEVQGTLLRVLETGCRQRVGGSKEIPCDVRLVAATNRDLNAMVKKGTFRRDLFQRLAVIRIVVPPLKDHLDDVDEIVTAWVSRRAPGHTLTAEQIAALKKYDYREGGVRELLNVVDRALALEISNFDELIREHVVMNATSADEESESENLEAAMRRHVRKVFAAHGNNVSQAAVALGVSRNTVARYLKGE